MIRLLASSASPFARTLKVLIAETGQGDIEIVDVTTSPLASDPALMAANPLGKLPALIRSDGPALYDSRVIARFLAARAGAPLYPEARLWETLTLEATAHGIMEAALAITYETRFRPEEHQWPDWADAQWARVTRALDAVEARWMSHLQGPLDMAHIAMGVSLGYLDLRHGARNWRAGHDVLANWAETFASRPSMQATAPV